MRQNGHGAITIEDVRTWIEETGLCIFLPRPAQAGQSVLIGATATPTFVEAVAGQRTPEPSLELIREAELLLVRLEAEGVAVRLNLGGQPLSPSGDQPDYIVAGWVLPYIYALRGDRDWRRSPQLTGSRQVSQLAVLAAKQLDSANMTATEIRDALGREVTEAAVLRALHELWKQLRIIPVVAEVGVPAHWQPLRQRFQKAIAEGASTSQVTAISVLASIYLQAVIAASMEDIEAFLSPLTSRSKIREVVRGLAATRQVHSTNMGHSPMFYVAGTLPEFPAVPTFQVSSTTPSYRSSGYLSNRRGSTYLSSYLGHVQEDDGYDAVPERIPATRVETPQQATLAVAAAAAPAFETPASASLSGKQSHVPAASPSTHSSHSGQSNGEARPASRPRPAV
jgi:23S rRNA pseudouridine2605 synthase